MNGGVDLDKAGCNEVVMHAKRGGVADRARGTVPDDGRCHIRG